MEQIEQDNVLAPHPRLGRVQRIQVINGKVKTRLRVVRDQIHDPILTVLTVLLAFLIFVVVPLHASGVVSAQGYDLAIVLVLASCVLVQSKTLMAMLVIMLAVGLAVAAIIFRLKLDSTLDIYLAAGACLTIGALLIFVIARAVFAPGRVTYHRINGAVLLYLTIGLTFVALFTFVGLLAPNSFSGLSIADSPALASNLIYFSFVTLTSTGYGDIVPVHPMARAFSNLEGIIGQLYPATLLARLVTLELEGRRK
ncbi:ion channel [Methylocapsa polymorpha]|uniref:Ion channel n=1 Tax=Methylocapsa polymorpha TaxID=3080828 RepID=A0ABZ0HLN5_9HYPH|nr:ion channel [Methylocapsa sp. RX1]